jgi:uncharacterized protein
VPVLVAYNNVVVSRLPGHPASDVPANVAATALSLGAARWAGLACCDLGLSRRDLSAGLRWGAACAGAVAAGYAVALALPPARPLLRDDRYTDLGGGEVAFQVLVRVPLGTVLWEEVAFRGVLLGCLARLLPLRAAVAGSSAVFGLWHVGPTLSALRANDLADPPLQAALLTVVAVAGTAAAGALLCWLRLRTASTAAPALLHLATNSLGTLAVVLARRWTRHWAQPTSTV